MCFSLNANRRGFYSHKKYVNPSHIIVYVEHIYCTTGSHLCEMYLKSIRNMCDTLT